MSEYGVPQKRKRFILVAMKKHSPKEVFEILEKNKEKFCCDNGIKSKTTVSEAISDLENNVERVLRQIRKDLRLEYMV